MEESFGTLSETMNGLKKEGYIDDLNVREERIIRHTNHNFLSPDDFEIDKVYRFEGESNPDDEAILYAISSKIEDKKGLVVNGYGISSNSVTAALVEKLQKHK